MHKKLPLKSYVILDNLCQKFKIDKKHDQEEKNADFGLSYMGMQHTVCVYERQDTVFNYYIPYLIENKNFQNRIFDDKKLEVL